MMPLSKLALALSTAVAILGTQNARAQIAPNSQTFFASDAPIALTLEAPLAELFASKDASTNLLTMKKTKVSGTVKYGTAVFPVEVRMRGFSSLTACQFPKLTLKFQKENTIGTVFEGLGKLDLSTHCDAKDSSKNFMAAMDYAHREALVYRWLKIMNIPAYAARMANLTYKDTSGKTPLATITKPAFFIENLSSFLKRADGIEIRAIDDEQHGKAPDNEEHRAAYTSLPDHPQIDREQLARITLFENMIGNYDYLLERDLIWNLKLIELKDGRWFPIPLDFNLSSVTKGEEVQDISYNEFFNGVDAAVKLKLIGELESKKSELYDAVALLESNSNGTAAFRAALKVKFERLEVIKAQILKAQAEPTKP